MRNISDMICKENQKTHFVFSNFFPQNLDVCEIMRKNLVQPDGPQVTARYGAVKMPLSCKVTERRTQIKGKFGTAGRTTGDSTIRCSKDAAFIQSN